MGQWPCCGGRVLFLALTAFCHLHDHTAPYESCQNHSLGARLMEASRHSIPRTMQQNAQIAPQASILRRNSHSGLLSTSDALPLEKGGGTRLLAHSR
ncbi:hypothetical protein B0H14DRAFT_2904112 [Mycena olivaceomarginata]|nr:hypothetical protein B0H14DRAFT_2904112 [Mycena olivaceomarginata]